MCRGPRWSTEPLDVWSVTEVGDVEDSSLTDNVNYSYEVLLILRFKITAYTRQEHKVDQDRFEQFPVFLVENGVGKVKKKRKLKGKEVMDKY